MVATRHVERIAIPGFRLGRRVPDPAYQKLRLKLTGQVPAHPISVDHFSKITNWGMLGNEKFGDCGPAAVAHYVMMVTEYLTGTMISPTLNDVLALYKLCNPTFDPTTGVGDNGVDMGQMLGFVCSNGIGGKTALAHATVDVSDLDALRAVTSIFGGVLLGVDLETAQQSQTTSGGPWNYAPSGEWGGHAVLGGLYTSDATAGHSDVSVVTWGQVMGTTDAFFQHQLMEAHVLIFPEHLGTAEFQQGVDTAALSADYQALTGQPFPVIPSPSPAPAPPPPAPSAITAAQTAANAQLATVAREWLAQWHPMGRALGQELIAWLQAWGL